MAAKRKEEKRAFIDNKQADEAALQEQRRADCLRIDTEARALLQQSQIFFGDQSTTLAAQRMPNGAENGPSSEAFFAELKELGAEGVDQGDWRRVEVRRSQAYWTQAHALLEADGCMRPTQFDYHLREQMQSKLWWLLSRRGSQVKEEKEAAYRARLREDDERRRLENLRRGYPRVRPVRPVPEWPFFIDLDPARRDPALQQSALARSSEPGSVVVKATSQVRPAQVCPGNVARNWQKGEFRVSLKLEAFTVA